MKSMKSFIVYPAVFLLFVATVQAQDEQPLSKWYTEAGFGLGAPSFNNTRTYLTTWDINVAFGYHLSPKFTLKIPASLSWNLFKDTENDNTSYLVDGLIGLAAGYYPGNGRRLQLTVEAGHTDGSSDEWRCFYYDLGTKIYLDAPRSRVGFIGLSLRQYISEIKDMPNYFMFHATIGFKAN